MKTFRDNLLAAFRNNLLAAIVVILLTLFVVKVCSATEIGLSLDYGWPITTPHGIKSTASNITAIIGGQPSNRLFIGIETQLSHLSFNTGDSTEVLSFSPILKYDFIRLKSITFYALMGCGIGFQNGGAPIDVLGHNPLGVIKAGVGIGIPLSNRIDLDIQCKYDHFSSHNPGDSGVNYLGPVMGLTWRW